MTSTPPSSPPSHFSANIFNTCRALHSYLGVQPKAARQPSCQPPRLGSPFTHCRNAHTKVEKRRAVPRGINKRRRNAYEEDATKDQENVHAQKSDSQEAPSTPKRQRVAPPSIPLGLERKDFYALQPVPHRGHRQPTTITTTSINTTTFTPPDTAFTFTNAPSTPPAIHTDTPSPDLATSPPENNDPDEWTTDDDTALVELVLEKLRFSRREWDEVATVLGTDGASMGRRWRELVGDGEVGLRFRRGRGRRERGYVRGVFDTEMEGA